MPPQQLSSRLELIEATRGVAAVLVVLYHVARHLDKAQLSSPWLDAFQFGHAGVDLFFVISGFIILHVHFKDIGKPSEIWNYSAKRITRIYPIYWLALLLTISMAYIGRQTWPSIGSILTSATLIPTDTEPLLGVAWTLKHEVFFYLVFAALITNKWVGLTAIAIWLAGLIIQSTNPLIDTKIPKLILSIYNFQFFLGMGIALTIRKWKNLPQKSLTLTGCFLFISLGIIENRGLVDGHSNWMRAAYGTAATLIIAGCAANGQWHLRVPRWLKNLGAASYSIYLFHFIFIGIAWKLMEKMELTRTLLTTSSFFILSLAGIGGGILISRLVEYPLMTSARRLFKNRK